MFDGPEFQVNTYTSDGQSTRGTRSVSRSEDGSFIVVWSSVDGQDGSFQGIYAQRFGPAGVAVGTEFRVNAYTTGSQLSPVVSRLVAGNFVVAWTSNAEIHGQRFDSTGTMDGTEFQVNTYTTASQYAPAADRLPAGKFVVVWTSDGSGGSDTSSRSIQGQRFDSMGAPDGTEFQVNTYTTSFQQLPAVSLSPDGGFVVAWTSFGSSGNDTSSGSVHGRRFDSTGVPQGSEFEVNTYTTSSQNVASISSGGTDDFVVVWNNVSSQDGSSSGVFGQLLCDDANANLICDSQETTTTSTSTITTTTTTLPPAAGCPPAPLLTCLGGQKAGFQVKDKSDDSKDQIKWKLVRGDAFVQTDLGDPIGTTVYTLCIYDETADAAVLVGSLTIDPSTKWDDKDPRGYGYKDKTGAEDGVTKVQLKANATAGKAKVQLKAKGSTASWPLPLSMDAYFDQDSAVTVQLVNDTTPACWSTAFTTAKKNTGDQFKAKAP